MIGGLNPFHLNKKYKKMNRHLLGKKLRCIPTKLNIFLANPNENLKNKCHYKIIFGHAVIQLLFKSTFFFFTLK